MMMQYLQYYQDQLLIHQVQDLFSIYQVQVLNINQIQLLQLVYQTQ